MALGLEQPSVSKHLRVLRDVGLVRMRCQGRQKLYRTDAEAIRPLHEWTGTFERYWQHQLNRIKERAEANARQQTRESPRGGVHESPRTRNGSNPHPNSHPSKEKP